MIGRLPPDGSQRLRSPVLKQVMNVCERGYSRTPFVTPNLRVGWNVHHAVMGNLHRPRQAGHSVEEAKVGVVQLLLVFLSATDVLDQHRNSPRFRESLAGLPDRFAWRRGDPGPSF